MDNLKCEEVNDIRLTYEEPIFEKEESVSLSNDEKQRHSLYTVPSQDMGSEESD